MELHRLGFKLFVQSPASISLRDFIPVFHGWIQKQTIEDHLLIDVHDYSHIQGGPGILLVAHEGNFSIDMAEARPGLLYYRKQQPRSATDNLFTVALRTTLQACHLLEEEGNVRFRTDELQVVANDRLFAPNDEGTFSQLRPSLSSVLKTVLNGADFTMTRVSSDPKERFMLRIRTGQSSGVKTLLGRI